MEMDNDTVSFTEINDLEAKSVEQVQTTRMCNLILLYTLRKLSPRSRKEG